MNTEAIPRNIGIPSDLESAPYHTPPTTTNARSHGLTSILKKIMLTNKRKGDVDLTSSPSTQNTNNPTLPYTQDSSVSSAPGSHTYTSYPPSASSDTVDPAPEKHGTDESFGVTAEVEHQMLPIAVVQQPPMYKGQRSPDYAKTDLSSAASDSTFPSYLSRAQKFFHDINELPWIAKRVTVDYVPGQSSHGRRASTRIIHRHSSWYGKTPVSRNQPHINSLLGTPASLTQSSNGDGTLPCDIVATAQRPRYARSSVPNASSPLAQTEIPKPLYPNGYSAPQEAATAAALYPNRTSLHMVHSPLSGESSTS